jgi:Holliday junction resolvasome RuvABC DNA-binding subunit
MKIIKKPVRNPREEMVAFNEGGEEDGRRQELFPLRAGAGRATRHFSASAAQIREGENSSSPSPARFCSSVTQTTGERNLLSALLADPEMNDFGDDTRGSRINAGEASTLRRTKLAQDEKRRSKKKDSNHRDRKVTEREVPFWRGGTNDATHQQEQDTQKEISSRRDGRSSRRNGHSSGTKARRHLSPQKEILFSSLQDCVEGMGFDPADIETAIESTDAKSSADAARVVEWLAEHRDKLRGSSTGTALTADSNERVEELHESLKELGFSADYIRRKKELYRRHSSKLGAEEFISAMLEVAASEDSSSSSDESSMEDFASPANISEIAEVTEADKRVLALDDSLRELGYCQELVKERQTSYRQYSNTMKPEDFISAMLEVEDGITATPARDVLPRPHGRG